MMNIELALQQMAHVGQNPIAIRVGRDHRMRRERVLPRRQAPDVQIVQLAGPANGKQVSPQFVEVYVRRYGFHGTSHHFVALEAAKRLSTPIGETQLISAHLGNGCSAAAIRNGQSMDTSMGLTPQEGLVMGTRSGDVDPNLHLFVQEKEHRHLREITEMLTFKSGLLGISGVSHDMRSVIAAAAEGNKRARLAVDLFCYRLARSVLGLAAALSSIDAFIFTGGIGENSAAIRAQVLTHLAILRPELDPKLNEAHGKGADGRITRQTGLLCLVIPTNEELMIARETALLTA